MKGKRPIGARKGQAARRKRAAPVVIGTPPKKVRLGPDGQEPRPRKEVRPEIPGAPADIEARTMGVLADVLGVHPNTMTHWKAEGRGPHGAAPWSVREYCCFLRSVGKLSSCKPNSQGAADIVRWAFTADPGAAANPDDPVHASPVGWEEEQKRQLALQSLTQRKTAQANYETLLKERIPIEEYRTRRQRNRLQVLGLLDSVFAAVNNINDAKLTLDQRTKIHAALAEWVQSCRQSLAVPVATPGGDE